jgi:hypothetical protein
MKKTTFRIVFNRRRRINKDGESLLQIEARLSNSRKYFSTGIHILPSQWNDKKKIVNQKHDRSIDFNRLIKKQIDELETFELTFLEKHGSFFLNNFDEINEISDFFERCEENIQNINSTKDYKNGLRRALKFIKQISPNLSFKSLNYELILTLLQIFPQLSLIKI